VLPVIGDRLTQLRKQAKMTQEQISKKLGIHRGTYANYEANKREPDYEILQKLADFFGVTTDYLLGRVDSSRSGGFSQDHGGEAKKKYLDLRLIEKSEDLPENVRKELQAPVLSYHTIQLRDETPMAISRSYLPNSLPLKELEKILEGVKKDPTLSLYKTLESVGRKPITCEETVSVDLNPTQEESQLLQIQNIPVIRISRKTFDASSHLVEYCLLTLRVDCYKLVYRFTL
jgi:transcriptional regulator with XRE-family HTH domain